MHIYALWCYFEKFLDEKNGFGEIHLHIVQSGVQMNLERLLDVDVLVMKFMNVFGFGLHVFFQLQQPECFQPNCTFYFRKPLHVFVTSFDAFGSWRRDASALSMVCEQLTVNSYVMNSPLW